MGDGAHPGLVHRPALEFSDVGLAEAFNRCFEGYVTPVDVGAAALESRCRSETADLAASRVYLVEGEVAGLGLVNRRGLRCRIGALGVAAGQRGRGVGSRMMRDVIGGARSRGDREVVLEVIEGNAPAVGLYRTLGFETARRLVGYRHASPAGIRAGEGDELDEIDPLDLARVVAEKGEPDLPWMLAPESLSAYAHPSRTYTLSGRAFVLIGDPSSETATLVAVVVPGEHRRRGWGTRIVRALFAAHPERAWSIAQIVPEDLAPGFFYALGFARDDLTQLEMRLTL
jgi:ribosomal protein S18 acetylase RimI-like enzyme